MKVLITGGTGFIGSHFIRRFPHHQFTVLVRDLVRAQKILPESVSCIESLDELKNLDAYDAVINLAGEPIIDKRWTHNQKEKICHSRWHLTESLVDLINESTNPPKVFLSGSAIGVYGDNGGRLIDESASVSAKDFPSTVCVRWEEIAAKVNKSVRLVNLRTGIVLARRQGALSKMLLPFKMGLGGPIGKGQQYMSWIHIDDMTSAMEFLLTNNELSGPVNLVAPNPVTNREFSMVLAAQLRRPALFVVPGLALKILMGESAALLLDSQRLAPEKLKSGGFEFQYPRLEQAIRSLLA